MRRDSEDNIISVIQDWSKEPFIRGGRSYSKPGATNADRGSLGLPVNDILFFAGHSESREHGKKGIIALNPDDSLDLEEIPRTLTSAIDQGLKLAIFNSCDGLGLAQRLADLNLPYVIVWREPVPDKIAQKFLNFFTFSLGFGKNTKISFHYCVCCFLFIFSSLLCFFTLIGLVQSFSFNCCIHWFRWRFQHDPVRR